jgi:nitrate/nitrite transport system permease protein
MDFIKRYKLDSLLLPLIGVGAFLVLWFVIAGKETVTKSVDDFGDPVVKKVRVGISQDLPTPGETWAS